MVYVVHDFLKQLTFIQNLYFFLEPYKVFIVVYNGTLHHPNISLERFRNTGVIMSNNEI